MKQLPITAALATTLVALLGAGTDVNKLAVFEMINVDSTPIKKLGSLFEGGVIPQQTLNDLSSFVKNNGPVPIITNHNMGEELPVGKIFQANVVDGQLRSLFYIPKDRTQLVSDIDNSVIDETSIGVLHKQILCSECGWDYRSPAATIMNIFERTCANGHTVTAAGEKGPVHVQLLGVQEWYETSFVTRGGHGAAKIVERAKAKLSPEQQQQLAASGIPFEPLVLVANFKEGSDEMDLKPLTEKIAEQATQLATLTAQLAASTARVTALEAEVAPGNTAIAGLATMTTERDALKADLTIATTFLRDHAERAAVATGKTKESVPAAANVTQLTALITEGQTNLVNLFEPGAHSRQRAVDVGRAAEAAAPGAFSVRRSLMGTGA